MVATNTVQDVKHWASKGDERVEFIGPFATEIVSYVAADGSNQVASERGERNGPLFDGERVEGDGPADP
jgi:hypothetical protein